LGLIKTHIMESIISQAALKAARRNLRIWYSRATREEIMAGTVWYSEAQQFARLMAQTYTVTGEVAAGVISALSPNNKWERNKYDTIQVFEAIKHGKTADEVKVCTYNNNKLKAFAIASGDAEILTKSPKTYAFARNVGELDPNFVTIDKWHLRACQTSSLKSKECRESVTPHQYKVLSEATVKVAAEYGIPAYVFQAIIWVTIRNRWN